MDQQSSEMIFKPEKGIGHGVAPALLAALLLVVFWPLWGGENFLPFGRLPDFCSGLIRTMGQEKPFDARYHELEARAPWVMEKDPAWFTIGLPQDIFLAREIRQGRLPLWDPYTGAGTPTFDSGQYRPFNFLRWPLLLAPSFWTYSMTLFAALLLGSWGAWLWLKREGLSQSAGMLGTAIFCLNPWVLERLAYSDAAAYFFLPWCMLGLSQLGRVSPKQIALAALPFILMAHAGHPEAALVFGALAAASWLLTPGSMAHAPEGESTLRLKAILAALVGTISIAATTVLWAPPLRLLFQGQSYKRLPILFDYDYSWRSLLAPGSDLFLLPAFIVLLIAAMSLGRRTAFWAVTGAACLCLVLPLPWLGNAIAMWLQRYGGFQIYYLKPVFWAAAAFLGAHGLDQVGKLPRLRLLVALAVGSLWLLGILLFMGYSGLSPSLLTRHPALAICFSAIGLLGCGAMSFKQSKAFATALAAIVVLPLAFPLAGDFLCWNNFRFERDEVADWVREQSPSARAISFGVIPPNWGQALGVRCGEESAVLFPNRFLELFHPRDTPPTLILYDREQPTAFRQMGVSLLLGEPLKNGEEHVYYEGRTFVAMKMPDCHGRLFFAEKSAPLAQDKSLGQQILAILPGSDAGVAVEALGAPTPAIWPVTPGGTGEARFVEDGIHSVTVKTRNPVQGLLVLKDSWYPGWGARVDGTKVPIYRVNGCFRGVIVPAGEHKVVFEYKPTMIYVSGAISLIVTLALLAIALWPRALHGGHGKPA